ncbi:MAG: uracil-DNA glycosylase [Alphaproteobacteria bacterium]|nr:uracil-DNA glycosylase [Alphaproteobacteria bacterium]
MAPGANPPNDPGAGGNAPAAPDAGCALCPRLVAFRADNHAKFPDFHNAPVASFGPLGARLLIVGLAPGLKGANRTGRPFTGDYAGDLLYPTLLRFGFARGAFGASADDGLELVDCRITNAVRCVPPQNKVTGDEAAACRPFLVAEIAAMRNLTTVLALGLVAHNAVLRTFGEKQSAWKFAHNARHALPNGLTLADSYHCSRYNTNTGRLTEAMFWDVFEGVRGEIEA